MGWSDYWTLLAQGFIAIVVLGLALAISVIILKGAKSS